jgi:prepilin-type N-terminal cleavage/methylation domain-containing protein
MSRRTTSNLGFTLVELLTVIAIIGILVGLALPGLAAAREAMRRASCNTNLRTLGTAAANHEIQKGEYPGYMKAMGVYKGAGTPHVKVGTWGVALLPTLDNQSAYEVWSDDSVSILNGTSYDVQKIIDIQQMQCPSDPNSQFEGAGKNSYAINVGYFPIPSPSGTDLTVNPSPARGNLDWMNDSDFGIANNKYTLAKGKKLLSTVVLPSPTSYPRDFPSGEKVSQTTIRDSKSQTLMFSENLQADAYFRLNPLDDGGLPFGLDERAMTISLGHALPRLMSGIIWVPADSATASGKTYTINGSMVERKILKHMREVFATGSQGHTGLDACALFASPSSVHNSGVNIVLVDGATRFVSDKIDYLVYQSLMIPKNKSSDAPAAVRNKVLAETDF